MGGATPSPAWAHRDMASHGSDGASPQAPEGRARAPMRLPPGCAPTKHPPRHGRDLWEASEGLRGQDGPARLRGEGSRFARASLAATNRRLKAPQGRPGQSPPRPPEPLPRKRPRASGLSLGRRGPSGTLGDQMPARGGVPGRTSSPSRGVPWPLWASAQGPALRRLARRVVPTGASAWAAGRRREAAFPGGRRLQGGWESQTPPQP